MSDENAPKLRLKPKLAVDPAALVPAPPAVPPLSEPPALAPVEESKSFRLKPKIAAEPAQAESPARALVPPTASITPVAPVAAKPPVLPPPEAAPHTSEMSAAKFSLKPKPSPEAVEAAAADRAVIPAPAAPMGRVLTGPPMPAPLIGELDEPAPPSTPPDASPEVVGATAGPFPPPPASFPPPPGAFPPPPSAGRKPTPPWAMPGGMAAPEKKKRGKAVLGAGIVAILLILGGGFVAYRKFTSEPPEPPPRPRVIPKAAAPTVVPTAPTKEAHAATASVPANSVEEPSAKPAIAAPVAHGAAVVVAAAAPPPPSEAFKGWVENLRVGGVRAGATTRVFIGGIAYATGELVNPQLGIVFESYSTETRRLTFKDKTGAIVEKRN